jgi:hypothetical protein
MDKYLPSDDLDPVDPDIRRLARRRFRAEVDAVPGGSNPEPRSCGLWRIGLVR